MILRRITEHVKAQNWTAIWIQFVLLVSGVFLGIQVANWKDERWLACSRRIFDHLDAREPYSEDLDICFGTCFWSSKVQFSTDRKSVV